MISGNKVVSDSVSQVAIKKLSSEQNALVETDVFGLTSVAKFRIRLMINCHAVRF